jgi:predicted ATPase
MSRIKIRNFGSIKDGCLENNGWIDIKKVTVFVGNQGSGKSTVAKLISTFTWIEKALVRGDYDKKWVERKNRLKNQFLKYHRLENYFATNQIENSYIEYQGEAYSITHRNDILEINELKTKAEYALPQIMYIPAERNFIAYVKTPTELKVSSEALQEFLAEFDKAKSAMNDALHLPVNNVYLEYDKLNDTLNLKGGDYKIRLTEASSGFQSLVPVFLVSRYLSKLVKEQSASKESMSNEERKRFEKGVKEIWQNESLTDELRRAAISVLASRFNKKTFVNIVEEPEQNLFPSSQWQLLQSLLEFNNMNDGNRLIMTTHSPYIIDFLNIALQAQYLKDKIQSSGKKKALSEKLNNIVSEKSLINLDDVAVYQLDELNGTIKKLPSEYDILSNKNYLNDKLREGNQLFDSLLEIEEEM